MTNIFNQLAKTYDTPQRQALAETILNEIRPDFAEASDKTLLDYGGGTGLLSLPLASLVKEVELLDLSEEMSHLAQEKATIAGLENFTSFQGDLLGEQPALTPPDIVLMSLVLLHIPDTKEILAALYQQLTPGGQLILVDFDTNPLVSHPKVHSGFDQGQLQELLQAIGFTHIKSHTFHTADHLFMNQPASMFHLRATKPAMV